MNVNTSMCDVNVYIPSDWQVENNMQNSLSDVDIDHSKGTGTKLILQGRNTMGDLTVKHVNYCSFLHQKLLIYQISCKKALGTYAVDIVRSPSIMTPIRCCPCHLAT